MDTLPPELLHQILLHLPVSSLQNIRLVSRTFSSLTFPILFKHIPFWLDYTRSHQAITQMAQDCYARPAVMWSPFAACPELDIESKYGQGWLEVCWGMLVGTKTSTEGMVTMIGSTSGEEKEKENKEIKVALTALNFATLSRNKEMEPHRLKVGMNRFLMWKGYREKRFLEQLMLGLPFCPY